MVVSRADLAISRPISRVDLVILRAAHERNQTTRYFLLKLFAAFLFYIVIGCLILNFSANLKICSSRCNSGTSHSFIATIGNRNYHKSIY